MNALQKLRENSWQLLAGCRKTIHPEIERAVGKCQVEVAEGTLDTSILAVRQPSRGAGQDSNHAARFVDVRFGMFMREDQQSIVQKSPVSFRNRLELTQ